MTLWLYVLGFMLSVQPPRSNDTRRLYEYSEIAWAIAKTDCTPLECITLASIGHMESGYVSSARGRLGEQGVFQVLPSSGPPTARNALHLLRVLTIDGYTGEANAKGAHPAGEAPRRRRAEVVRRPPVSIVFPHPRDLNMPILSLLIVLVVFGVGLYLLGLIPMDPTVRKIIQVVAILAVVLWLLQALGLFAGLGSVRLR